jgi:hypothetical protein
MGLASLSCYNNIPFRVYAQEYLKKYILSGINNNKTPLLYPIGYSLKWAGSVLCVARRFEFTDYYQRTQQENTGEFYLPFPDRRTGSQDTRILAYPPAPAAMNCHR